MHTDDAFAQSAGYPGVFAHGMLSMGYLAEFLVQAGGVGAVRRFKTRFAKLTWPGDLITCRGRVTRVADEGGERRVECEMWTENQMGEQHGWASRVAAFLGLTPSFCSTMDMGGATAIGMIQTAVMAIEAGFCSTVLCAFACQNNPQGVIPTLFGSPWAIPYGDVGAITFMGHVARRQMHEHGITSRQYGQIAVTWRKHAATNPLAQKRAPITLEDHQSSKLINDPLRLLDCCLVTDGGGAVIVTSLERACDLRQKPAVISGLG